MVVEFLPHPRAQRVASLGWNSNVHSLISKRILRDPQPGRVSRRPCFQPAERQPFPLTKKKLCSAAKLLSCSSHLV